MPELAGRRAALRSLIAASFAMLAPATVGAMASRPATRGARLRLARRLARQTGLPAAEIERILERARFDPSIIERIERPYEARPYAEYRPLFVTPAMQQKGRAFMRAHARALAAAREQYAVEAEIITAILGLETRYGAHHGTDRVLDALFTLATGFERRSDFFTKELGEFLLLCREEGLKPEAVRGSYAGAFGITQFIPSSYRAYAVDADGDGRRDVWNSMPDAIASVANYFHRHGWQYGRPVARWIPDSTAARALLGRGLPERAADWPRLGDTGIRPPAGPWSPDDPVGVIELETAQGKRLALVHRNFYVITRWNRSYNYAMATTELAAMLGCQSCEVGR